jgi:diacylglycerol O-acyltransferase
MSERLRPRDLAFLEQETPSAPRHNATVEVFAPHPDGSAGAGGGFDYDRFVALILDRISFVPRYRQRVQEVPGHLANPVWVDDDHFDVGYHVRRSALPRPGNTEQLRELVSRIIARPLDRARPLWEIYFVEGLADGRVAILYKTHQALVDGVETVDLGQVLLDKEPELKLLGGDEWHPHRHPSNAALLAAALHDNLTEPATAIDTARHAVGSALRTADRLTSGAGRVVGGLTGRRPDRGNALTGELSQQRRVVGVETQLKDYRTIRDEHGGTINDVILATLTGALRAWLMTRAESMGGLRQIQAVVPVSVIDRELEATSLGSQIAPHFVTLPIAEASPVVRLHQVSYSFKAHKETGRAVAANRLAGIAGFAPTTFHAIGSRVAADAAGRRDFQISITNVPGPQSPLYAAGARMLRTFPIPPLLPDQALAVGVTSYDGQVFYGITADRDLIPDADVLGQCVTEALTELLDTATGGRPKIPRGRRKKAAPKP